MIHIKYQIPNKSMYRHPCLLDSLDNCTFVLPHLGHWTLIAIILSSSFPFQANLFGSKNKINNMIGLFAHLLYQTQWGKTRKNPKKDEIFHLAPQNYFAENGKCRNPFVSGISQCKGVAKEISVKNFKTESNLQKVGGDRESSRERLQPSRWAEWDFLRKRRNSNWATDFFGIKIGTSITRSDMVWVTGIEPATSWTPFKHATKLRYTQKPFAYNRQKINSDILASLLLFVKALWSALPGQLCFFEKFFLCCAQKQNTKIAWKAPFKIARFTDTNLATKCANSSRERRQASCRITRTAIAITRGQTSRARIETRTTKTTIKRTARTAKTRILRTRWITKTSNTFPFFWKKSRFTAL